MTFDGGENSQEPFVFGSENNTTGTKVDHQALNAQAAHEVKRLKALGFDRGSVVIRKTSREQALNPWTWGLVILTTPVPIKGEIVPLGVIWMSSASSRAVENLSADGLLLISAPPTEESLKKLRDS